MLHLNKGDTVGPWIIQKKLGEGAYGSVYSVTCKSIKDKEYALKIAPINKNPKKNQAAQLINHEIMFLRLRIGAFQKDFPEVPFFPRASGAANDLISGKTKDNKIQYLAMEKFDLGLSDYVQRYGGKLPTELAYSVAAKSISILKFLHNKYVLYNDIKVDNFMLRNTTNGYQLAIIDMGAASVKVKGKKMESMGERGTPLFTSINSNTGGAMYFSDDLSAIGYMIAYLILGYLPWENCRSNEEIIKMKEEKVLDKELQDYPELLTFIQKFRTLTSDYIDYDKWTNYFSNLVKTKNKALNPMYLPKQVDLVMSSTTCQKIEKQNKKEMKEMKEMKEAKEKKTTKETKETKEMKESKEKETTKETKEAKEKKTTKETKETKKIAHSIKKASKNDKTQKIINNSPFSANQVLGVSEKDKGKNIKQAMEKKATANSKPTRIQPSRKCKHV